MEATTNPALASLKDIQTPDVIASWPIAYGYWVTLALIIVTITAIFYLVKRRRLYSAPKRIVIVELNELDPNHKELSSQVNTLIKRAAMSYLPRERIAGLEGQTWYSWMNTQVKQPDPQLQQLLDKRYQREGLASGEGPVLKALAHQWLKEALPIKVDSANSSQTNTEEHKC
ncbi:conserved hypothetical protein [Shewanella sediminis HAW-EB3]|uniref:DUF4381 domain-containing protein n=1 Tax=Shewanella sediminis (strain HAW-EB3) TaxID=425104 RepID=A8FTR3_SHESH|nr:DUF4381 domain-containing protein [Shewanella sediminis]ABV36236.1 conserved hypothetical protein [Shewanella sediminis HAW-EB3]